MVRGIDVSAVQGVLDWSKVDPDVKFVIHRCGVGNDHPVKDGCYEANTRAAKASGRLVGAYHFPYPLPVVPGHEDRAPELQARAHWAAQGRDLDLPPMMDLEWPAPQDWPKWSCTAASIKAFAVLYLAEMDRLSGRVTGIYIYPDYEHHLGDMSMFAGRPWWLAAYGAKPWKAYSIWQNSGGGGHLYNGAPVDTDVAEEAALAELVLGGTQSPAETDTPASETNASDTLEGASAYVPQ